MKANIKHQEVEIDAIDMAATERMQVEILPEVGVPGHYKLYVHDESGWTIIRICKLNRAQINTYLMDKKS